MVQGLYAPARIGKTPTPLRRVSAERRRCSGGAICHRRGWLRRRGLRIRLYGNRIGCRRRIRIRLRRRPRTSHLIRLRVGLGLARRLIGSAAVLRPLCRHRVSACRAKLSCIGNLISALRTKHRMLLFGRWCLLHVLSYTSIIVYCATNRSSARILDWLKGSHAQLCLQEGSCLPLIYHARRGFPP